MFAFGAYPAPWVALGGALFVLPPPRSLFCPFSLPPMSIVKACMPRNTHDVAGQLDASLFALSAAVHARNSIGQFLRCIASNDNNRCFEIGSAMRKS